MLKNYYLLLLFVVYNSVVFSQKTVTFEEGTFDIAFKANISGSDVAALVKSNGDQRISLDYTSVEKPSLQIYLQNVQWKGGIEDNTLLFKSGWLSAPKGIKKVTNRDNTLKKSTQKKKYIYQPLKNGDYTITIKYAVVKPGEDASTAKASEEMTYQQKFRISGFKDAAVNSDPIVEEQKSTPEEPVTPKKNEMPIGWQGNEFNLGKGKVRIELGTNISGAGGGRKVFEMQGNSNLDYTNVENPQVWISVSKLNWIDKEDGAQLVIKSGWLEVDNTILNKGNFSSLKMYSNDAKRQIPLKVNTNGATTIKLMVGYSDKGASLGSISPVNMTIVKTLIIEGVGAKTNTNNGETTNSTEDIESNEADQKDLELWNTVKTENTFQSYLNYWETARKGEFRNECYRELVRTPIRWEFKDKLEMPEGGKMFTIQMNDIREIVLDTLEGGMTAKILPDNKVNVTIIDGKSRVLTITDDFKRMVEIPLDPASEILRAEFNEVEGIINYIIHGAKSPYYLSVVDAMNTNNRVCNLGRANLETNGITRKQIYEICDHLEGVYKIKVQDVGKRETVYSEQNFELKSDSSKNFLSYLWIILAVLLIPIGIIIKKNL